jgi:hypothetical protein
MKKVNIVLLLILLNLTFINDSFSKTSVKEVEKNQLDGVSYFLLKEERANFEIIYPKIISGVSPQIISKLNEKLKARVSDDCEKVENSIKPLFVRNGQIFLIMDSKLFCKGAAHYYYSSETVIFDLKKGEESKMPELFQDFKKEKNQIISLAFKSAISMNKAKHFVTIDCGEDGEKLIPIEEFIQNCCDSITLTKEGVRLTYEKFNCNYVYGELSWDQARPFGKKGGFLNP